MGKFTIIGHRGACAHEPENSLRSVQRAIDDGADMVEVDVRLVGGEVIVIHDDTLERTTDGHGSVYERSFSELREFDAGKGERIPTLTEVLELTRYSLPLNIEIKDRLVAPAVCRLLASFDDLNLENIIVSSFHEQAVIEVRERLPKVPIGILAHDKPEAIAPMFDLAAQLKAFSVHPHINSVSQELVKQAHRSSYRVLPYTARTPEQLTKLFDCGADGCFADDPKWAHELAEKQTKS